MLPNAKALNAEGNFFTTNNAQTGIALTLTAAYDATKPFVIVENHAAAGGKDIILDFLDLITVAAGSAASGLTQIQAAVALDNVARYGSAGSDLSGNIVQPNSGQPATSIAKVYAGQITPAAASALKLVSGLRNVRPCVSATVADVVGEQKHFVFSGADANPNGNIVAANPNIITIPMPPICIKPGHSALFYLFYAASGTPVAATYAPELGWSER